MKKKLNLDSFSQKCVTTLVNYCDVKDKTFLTGYNEIVISFVSKQALSSLILFERKYNVNELRTRDKSKY